MIERLDVVLEQLSQRLEVRWRRFPRHLSVPSGGGGGACHGGGGGGGGGFIGQVGVFVAFCHWREPVFGGEGLGFLWRVVNSGGLKGVVRCGDGRVAVLDPELRWIRIRCGLAMGTGFVMGKNSELKNPRFPVVSCSH